ncbi:MAG: amino acid ABC transporter permease [Clostridiales bacterium]
MMKGGKQLLFAEFYDKIYLSLIYADRWKQLFQGLGTTAKITLGALAVGIVLGILLSLMKVSNNRLLRMIADIYLTVIRGTPMVVQLLIMWYFVLVTMQNKVLAAIIAFGINSGAYVAEIIRGGILAVDYGQTEAGRSLGLNYMQNMRYIVLPQAFKNALPPLGNELITLFKETAIVGYIALKDLTRVADTIRSATYSPVALFTAALMYLMVVLILTQLLAMFERRLRASDKR